jgi:hypothetical protein
VHQFGSVDNPHNTSHSVQRSSLARSAQPSSLQIANAASSEQHTTGGRPLATNNSIRSAIGGLIHVLGHCQSGSFKAQNDRVLPPLQAHGISDLWEPDGRGPTQVLQPVRHREDEELALRASAVDATQHATSPLNVTEECVTNYAIVVGWSRRLRFRRRGSSTLCRPAPGADQGGIKLKRSSQA